MPSITTIAVPRLDLLLLSAATSSPTPSSFSPAFFSPGRHGRPRSSAPSLRPTPRRPCRRRRLGRPSCPLQELRADPAACRPPSPVRRRELPDPPVSDLPRHPSPVPDVSSAPESQASDAARPCLLCPGGRHGGHRLSVSIRPPSDPCWCSPGTRHGGCRPSRLDPSAPGSTAEQPRSAARSVTPRPAKASAEADKAHRKANGLAKLREDLRARVASRKRARELAPCWPRPPLATSYPLCTNARHDARVFFAKMKRYLVNRLKIGLRVELLGNRGTFPQKCRRRTTRNHRCFIITRTRTRTRKRPVRCNGRKK
ncbi:translation initiation factor IF-2 [Triticum aestivum]|uniref:translation initiation factor IF-2 n=1 Tax=Triticum aestivum TaxID=4565 RepID=UPI001D01F471|nr:translation initiation factor IF-2-like [Triticum aestivum]